MMSSEESYPHWAWMLADMREDALSAWRDTYAPAVAVADLYAMHLRRTRIVCDEFAGGVWHIGIKVQPRRASQTEWYWWKVRKLAGMYYIL
jgi:hypothetical protein